MYGGGDLAKAVNGLVISVIFITILLTIGITLIVKSFLDNGVVYEGNKPLNCDVTITTKTKSVSGRNFVKKDTLYTYREK